MHDHKAVGVGLSAQFGLELDVRTRLAIEEILESLAGDPDLSHAAASSQLSEFLVIFERAFRAAIERFELQSSGFFARYATDSAFGEELRSRLSAEFQRRHGALGEEDRE